MCILYGHQALLFLCVCTTQGVHEKRFELFMSAHKELIFPEGCVLGNKDAYALMQNMLWNRICDCKECIHLCEILGCGEDPSCAIFATICVCTMFLEWSLHGRRLPAKNTTSKRAFTSISRTYAFGSGQPTHELTKLCCHLCLSVSLSVCLSVIVPTTLRARKQRSA